MTTDENWAFLLAIDDEYLLGSVMLSEWTTFLVRDVDTAFSNHANLTAILAAQSTAVYLVGLVAQCVEADLTIRQALFDEESRDVDLLSDVVGISLDIHF